MDTFLDMKSNRVIHFTKTLLKLQINGCDKFERIITCNEIIEFKLIVLN